MTNLNLRVPVRNIAHAFAGAVRRIRVVRWTAAHKHLLLIFNWHQISPSFDAHRHHRYTWTALERFVANIDYLAARFQIVSLYDAIERLKTDRLRGRCVALTFDDGDISIAEFVVPFLRGRSLPATFFINTAYLDSNSSYWFPVLSYFCSINDEQSRLALSSELKNKALKLRSTEDVRFYNEVRNEVEQLAPGIPNLASRLVSSQWLSDLDGELFAIGAHGHEHQRFSMMSPDWQRGDLQQNIKILSQFRAYRPIFAAPFGRCGDWSPTTLRVAEELGLDVVVADGGVNIGRKRPYDRQPADGQIARDLVTDAILTGSGSI